jgi:hypothetical protein
LPRSAALLDPSRHPRATVRPNSHRGGHWFDPSIAHRCKARSEVLAHGSSLAVLRRNCIQLEWQTVLTPVWPSGTRRAPAPAAAAGRTTPIATACGDSSTPCRTRPGDGRAVCARHRQCRRGPPESSLPRMDGTGSSQPRPGHGRHRYAPTVGPQSPRELGPEVRLVYHQTHNIHQYVIRSYAWRR